MENKEKGQDLVNFIFTRIKQGYNKNEILKEIQNKWSGDKNDSK